MIFQIDAYSSSVTNLKCATGYTGIPTAECNVDRELYTLSGCTKIPACKSRANEGGYVRYEIKNDGSKCDDFVDSMAECAMAAKELFLSDVTPVDDNYGSRYTPKGCYFDHDELKFNVRKRSYGPCYGSKPCICKIPGVGRKVYDFSHLNEQSLYMDSFQ